MLMRFDPFRELDRLTQETFGSLGRTSLMAMDAYREGDHFVVNFDLPGVDPASIDLTVEQNVLSVTAGRDWQPAEGQQVVASERPQGRFSRQLFLGESLDAEHISASYHNGVLSLTLPVAEEAKPRKVEITIGGGEGKAIETNSVDTTAAAA